jgi:hypothetical protein
LPASVKAAVFSGAYAGGEVTLVVSGKQDTAKGPVDQVGTVPAALHTYLAIEAFKPDVVVNAGTCGGFKAKGCAIGDKYVPRLRLVRARRACPAATTTTPVMIKYLLLSTFHQMRMTIDFYHQDR